MFCFVLFKNKIWIDDLQQQYHEMSRDNFHDTTLSTSSLLSCFIFLVCTLGHLGI